MSKLLEDIKDQHQRGMELSTSAIDWLIVQAEKAEQYKKMLEEIIVFTKYDGNQWYSDAKNLLNK